MKSGIANSALGSEPAFFSPDVASARRFYLDLKPTGRQPLAVVSGGLEHCTADYAIHRKTFPFFSIEYVARGEGRLRLGGRQNQLEPGAIFSYGPGVPHDITGDPASPLVKYFVNFSGWKARGTLGNCKLPPGRVARVYPPHTLVSLFDELIESGSRSGRAGAPLCVKLLDCMTLKIAVANAPLRGVETLAFATYQHCRRHIERNCLRLRSLAEIATECRVDKAYVCRLFQRYDQQSPYQYLLRLKLNCAAEKLQGADALVKQVAEETGFADPFHFSRVFRRLLGVSPAAFKKLR